MLPIQIAIILRNYTNKNNILIKNFDSFNLLFAQKNGKKKTKIDFLIDLNKSNPTDNSNLKMSIDRS